MGQGVRIKIFPGQITEILCQVRRSQLHIVLKIMGQMGNVVIACSPSHFGKAHRGVVPNVLDGLPDFPYPCIGLRGESDLVQELTTEGATAHAKL